VTIGVARTPLALLLDLLAGYAAVAVFVAVFGQGDGPAPSFTAVAAVVLLSYVLARALQVSDVDEHAMRVLGVALSAVALFVIARVEYAPGEWVWDTRWIAATLTDTSDAIRPNAHVIAGVVALAPLWLRGVIRGQSSIEFDSVLTGVSLGLLAVIVAALAVPDTREAVSWGAFALVYGAAGLLALALFRAPEPDAPIASFAQRWTALGAMIAGVAVAVAMITAALDPESFGFLAPLGDPLRHAGNLVGTYVLGPIFWLIYQPFRFAGWLLHALFPDAGTVKPEEPERPALTDPNQEQRREQPWWWQVFWWGVGSTALILISLVALVLLWSSFRRFARRKADAHERRESLEPASSLAADLGDLMRGIAQRFRRSPRAQHALEIRRLYFEMLDAADATGLARPAAATPLQFAPSLDAHFASPVPSSITRAFAESRYGELPIPGEAVAQLRQGWDALRSASQSTV
jgi:hypothetical protein